MFPITSVCIGDIIQNIEDDNSTDELQKIFLIKRAKKLNKNQMKWIAKKMADDFCNTSYWDSLTERFKQIIDGEDEKEL